MMMDNDTELLLLAANAAGLKARFFEEYAPGLKLFGIDKPWNPILDDGERYRLISALKINIDWYDECAWIRLPNGELIQEFWGEEYGDEPHAVLRATAEIGRQGKD